MIIFYTTSFKLELKYHEAENQQSVTHFDLLHH